MGKALPMEKLLSESELSKSGLTTIELCSNSLDEVDITKFIKLFTIKNERNNYVIVESKNQMSWCNALSENELSKLWKSNDKTVDYINKKGENKTFRMTVEDNKADAVQLYLKFSDIYCLDIDYHKFENGQVLQSLYDLMPFLKSCPFTLSRTKSLPHFYFKIQGIEQYIEEVNIINDKNIEADLLHPTKAPIELLERCLYYPSYDNRKKLSLPTFQWNDIKQYFNIEQMNFENKNKSSSSLAMKSSTEGIQSCISQGIESSKEGTNYEGDKKKWFELAMICARHNILYKYAEWIVFAMILKNELGDDAFDLFHDISKVCDDSMGEGAEKKYKGLGDCHKYWNSIKIKKSDEKKYTFGTLIKWAKDANKDEFNQWNRKYTKCLIQDEEEQQEKEKTEMDKAIEQLINEGKKHDITKFYFDFIRPNKYIYKKEEKENKWFVLLENNRWNQQKEILIQLDFVKEMRNILKTYKDKYGLTDKQEEKYNKILSIIGDSPDKLIKKSNEYCVDDKVTFTPNPYLFCFDNVVYDLKTCEMRNYKFDDYQVMSTGYDWVEPTEEQINEVNHLLCKIYPNKYNRDFALMYFSTGFIGITIQAMLFSIGKGGNGKSFIKSFCESAFGKYAGVLSPINLSYPLKGSGQSNPELAQLENKRIVFVSEPSENLDIDNSTFKKLTGDSKLEARNHQVSKSSIDICGTYCMDANNCPKFKNGSQDAEARRCFAVYYESEFTNDLERIDEKKHIYLANSLYGSSEWLSNNKFALIKILMKYFKEFKENNYSLVISDFIREESRKFLENSDFYSSLFEENNNIKYVKKLFEFNSKTMTMKDIIEKDNYVKLNDIYDIFIESQSYINLPYNEKKSHSKKHFINKISNSPLYKKAFKDVVGLQGGGKEYNILLGYKIINPYDINNNPKENNF
jgi:phage/plasmid-associated DNA primase